jgi:hypothetical protein
MPSKGEVFVQEFVLGFGFLGGLFTWAGVDPEEEIVKGLLRAFLPNNESMVAFVLVLFVLLSTILGIFGTLAMAGKLGLVVVALAWISGFLLPVGGSWTILGLMLLIAAFIAGPIVCDRK